MSDKLRESAQQALEWIEDASVVLSHVSTAIQGGVGAEAEGVGGCSVKVVDALREALAQQDVQAVVQGMKLVPDWKGYALLGTGNYVIEHSADFDSELGAELIIRLATDEDREDGRQIGESRSTKNPGAPIYPEDMVIRIGFLSERALFALEDQLRLVRETHFAPTPPAQQDAQAVPSDLVDKLRKFRGLPPHNNSSNVCQGDGYFYASIEAQYTPAQIAAANDMLNAAPTSTAQQDDTTLLIQCLTAVEAMMQEFRALDLPYGSKAYALAKDCRLDLIKRLATEPNAETVAAMQEARQMAARDNKD